MISRFPFFFYLAVSLVNMYVESWFSDIKTCFVSGL